MLYSGDDTEVQSEDSNETIGKCTNPSIVTGTTYYRADSPINQTKLNRHHQKYSSRQAVTRANLRRYNLQQLMTNKGSPSFEYPTTPSIGPNNRTQTQYRRDEQLAWRHPGGVVSLLEILGRVLRSTEEQLVAIGKIANLTDFVQNVCIITMCHQTKRSVTLYISVYIA